MAGVPAGGTSTVPVLILKEGTQRTTGYDALRANITAAMAIAETVKSSLGPRGMDKMLIDTIGDITNDGATILNEIEVQHPAAKLLVQIAKTQDDEVGDGTTTSVVIAGQLLKEAEELIDKNVHPTVIVSGYRKAEVKAREVIDALAMKVDINDDETLKKVALTSIHGKSVSSVKDHLADICVKAVKAITEERNGKRIADINKIQLIKKQGGGLLDTTIVYGVIVDKEVVHPGMPKKVTNAKIALIDAPLEIEKTEIDAEIRISNPEQMKAFLDEEEKMLRNMVEKIKSIGANVVFCQKGIDDVAQHYLAKAGILAVRRVKKSDMEKLALATGGKIVTNIEDLTPEDLGEAALVEERRVAGDKMVFVEGCKNPKSVSILIRGGLERLVDEAERSIVDALSVVSDVIEDPRVVYGGGAIEIEISKALRKYAATVGGREQLAIEAFAKGVEAIPRALAENAGGDPIDALAELKSLHEEGKISYGINGFTGKPDDMAKLGVIEPASVKIQAISSATEAAATILRIDDIIAASKISKAEKGPEKEKKEEEEKD